MIHSFIYFSNCWARTSAYAFDGLFVHFDAGFWWLKCTLMVDFHSLIVDLVALPGFYSFYYKRNPYILYSPFCNLAVTTKHMHLVAATC